MAKTLGRFNFITVRQDKYDVLYMPMYGDLCIKVAKGLEREEALGLMNDLNEVIDDFRRMNMGNGEED